MAHVSKTDNKYLRFLLETRHSVLITHLRHYSQDSCNIPLVKDVYFCAQSVYRSMLM